MPLVDVKPPQNQPPTTSVPSPRPAPAPGPSLPSGAPLGPSLPSADAASSLPEPSPSPDASASASASAGAAPSSPYTTARSLIHDLTLPSVPSFDIPPSPPGSPPAGAASTDRKVAQFLELKKRGTHFNAKLEQSSALRNPALTDKLLAFVDIPPPPPGGSSAEGRDRDGEESRKRLDPAMQYQTTLPADVWDPSAFPAWAFRDGLRRGREKVAKEREAARGQPGRSSVEFVTGGTTGGGASGGGGLSRGEKRKGGWQ